MIPVEVALLPMRDGCVSRSGLVASVRAIARWHDGVGHLYIDESKVNVVRVVVFVKAEDPHDAVAQCESLVHDLQRHGESDFAAVIIDRTSL